MESKEKKKVKLYQGYSDAWFVEINGKITGGFHEKYWAERFFGLAEGRNFETLYEIERRVKGGLEQEVKQLKQELGLTEISYEHQKSLRLSCEKSLEERDQEIKELREKLSKYESRLQNDCINNYNDPYYCDEVNKCKKCESKGINN
jgi:hypothetical protein